MRILHLISNLSGGGAERQLGYLATELARRGHDVHSAYCHYGHAAPELPGVSLHRLKSLSNYDPYIFWQLVLLIRKLRPDIVHTWILQMDVLGGIAARVNRIPWILREPNQALAYPGTWKHRLRVCVGSYADAIVANSFGGADYWRSKIPDSILYIIRNGLPMEEIDNANVALPRELERIQTPIILCVGRLEAHKGQNVLLEAISLVRSKQPVSAVLCGEGSRSGSLDTLKNKLGLEGYVYFMGQLPPQIVWTLMKKAAVVVSLSMYEGHPNSVIEAMRCACPLVLSDIRAHREILEEQSANFVEPGNVLQTADKILDLLTNKTFAESLALNAKKKTTEWSIAAMAQSYEKVYMGIIKCNTGT